MATLLALTPLAGMGGTFEPSVQEVDLVHLDGGSRLADDRWPALMPGGWGDEPAHTGEISWLLDSTDPQDPWVGWNVHRTQPLHDGGLLLLYVLYGSGGSSSDPMIDRPMIDGGTGELNATSTRLL